MHTLQKRTINNKERFTKTGLCKKLDNNENKGRNEGETRKQCGLI